MKDDIKEILDYLGNDNIEKPFGMATIDKHKLLDYITNLQQSDIDKQLEIIKLKDKLEYQRKEYQEVYKDVRIELKEKNETITNLQEENEMYAQLKDEYEDIIDKAIDKLYCYGEAFDTKIMQQFQKEMLGILQGEDKEC